jgi:hypothetical protein
VRSKKPSAAKPPDETVFFIDRSLGLEPIRAELIKSGLVVEIHDDHFERDADDQAWLKKVGWVGSAHKRPATSLSPAGDRRFASQSRESIRSHGW